MTTEVIRVPQETLDQTDITQTPYHVTGAGLRLQAELKRITPLILGSLPAAQGTLLWTLVRPLVEKAEYSDEGAVALLESIDAMVNQLFTNVLQTE